MQVLLNKNRQRGSATVLGLLVVMLTIIMISGIVPAMISEVKFSSLNRDLLEAQYAAEAGAKYAVTQFLQNNTDWSWAQGSGTPKTFVGTETYTVKIVINGTSTPIANGFAPQSNTTYKIQSIGRAGSAGSTVTVLATAGSGGAPINPIYAADSAIYAGNDIKNSGQITVSGADVVYNGHVDHSQTINVGKPYVVLDKSLPLDAVFDAKKYEKAPHLPAKSGTVTLTQSTYYMNGNWSPTDNLTLNVSNNQNVTIFTDGNFSTNKTVTMNGSILFIVKGTISSSKDFSMSSGVLYGNGDVTLSSNTNIKSGALIAKGTIAISDAHSLNVNYNAGVITAFGLQASASGGTSASTVSSWNNQ